MAGILGSNVTLSLFEADPSAFSAEKLRQHAFVPTLDADLVRFGWVGLGDMLDFERFDFSTPLEGYVAFSFRCDVRKPAAALLKLKLAEAVQAEEAKKNGHISKARKKELREEITDQLSRKADFVPTLTDCLWSLDKGKLFITSTSAKVLENILAFFQTTFEIDPQPLRPEVDMGKVLMQIHQSEDLHVGGYSLISMGSASLVTTEQAEAKSQVTVQNDLKAVEAAIKEGLLPNKLHLQATAEDNEDLQLDFVLGSDLTLNKFKFPKPEKGADREAVFLVNADLCSRAADLLGVLGKGF